MMRVNENLYAPVRKYSVTLSGHRTSITLEPAFWEVLQSMAQSAGLTMSAYLARIDRERLKIAPASNFSSVLRLKVLEQLLTYYPNVAIQGNTSSSV